MSRLAGSVPRRLADIWWVIARGASISWAACVVALSLSLAGTLVVIGYVDASITETYAAELAAGGNVVIVAGDGTAIDRAECSHLRARDDVRSAGSVRFGEIDHTSAAPGVGVMTAGVDPGMLQVLDPRSDTQAAGPGVVLAGASASEVGARAGSLLTWHRLGRAPVSSVIDVAPRAPEMDRWAFDVVAAVGAADECWVEATPGQRGVLERTVQAGLPSTAGASVRALRPVPPEEAVDATVLVLWVWAPVVGALLAAAIVVMLRFFDRSGLALLQLIGLSRVHVAFVRAIHSMWTHSVATVFALVICSALSWITGVGVTRVALQALCLVLATGILVDVLLALVRPANPLVTLRAD